MKKKILNKIISDAEIEGFLEYMEDSGKELEKELKTMFSHVIFIGTSINKRNKQDLDAFIINLEICNYYFQKIEDYIKVKHLTELSQLLRIKKKVKISRIILKKISLNLN